jgi:dynein heavy chain
MERSILWGNFLRPGSGQYIYEEVRDMKKCINLLEQYNAEFNLGTSGGAMNLVFFKDAVEHVCRIARVLSQPRGSLMLVGVGGSGRQSLTRLSCAMYEDMQRFEIELTKGYGLANFREDELALLKICGAQLNELAVSDAEAIQGGMSTCFLLNDTRIRRGKIGEICLCRINFIGGFYRASEIFLTPRKTTV